ncbi:transposase [Olsenella profusa]|uniref:transposase n=1 Tax=Olsenella profusa TaxID=138595 RepID=UPI00351FA3AB
MLKREHSRAFETARVERGSALRKRRPVDVEAVFGGIRRSWRLARFCLRSLREGDHELRLVAAGRNLRKLALALTA